MRFKKITEIGKSIAPLIDHTLLKPDASRQQMIALCREAINYGFATVCVNPFMVRLAAKELKESSVKVCSVIGFPLGASTTEAKAFEADNAVSNGARELDMVISVTALKDHNYKYVSNDIKAVIKAGHGNLVKVILETCLLTDKEKITASRLVMEAGADFVKTSTGFSKGGATVKDIKLIRQTVGDGIGIKASGGIHTTADALKMIDAGAGRIGASAGIAIVT